MHSVATQNIFGEYNVVIIGNVEFWPLAVIPGMCHSSTCPGTCTSLHVTQFYQAFSHVSNASNKCWGEKAWVRGYWHCTPNSIWLVSVLPIINTDHRTTESSTSDSLGAVSWVQKATLQLYRRNVPLLHTSTYVTACDSVLPGLRTASDKRLCTRLQCGARTYLATFTG